MSVCMCVCVYVCVCMCMCVCVCVCACVFRKSRFYIDLAHINVFVRAK